ncbi:MAG TPA: NotI family restriction endonuclease [Terracidiphilus sp.]|nr:NotI family restriction endonuclease [Terracidiphilus sp.]
MAKNAKRAPKIIEFFGFSPQDHSKAAVQAREDLQCPFLQQKCTKTLSRGEISGACTLTSKIGGPVICCPNRLYAEKYEILRDIARIAFGPVLPLLAASSITDKSGECIAVFGKGWGKELRLPNRGKRGSYFVDWILAHLSAAGELINFVAVEVQSIDTTGNYRKEREAYLAGEEFEGRSTANLNWENVNKRILPQIIYKGHVLRQEPLCQKGLFFVCPSRVYEKISERLGGNLRPYPIQPGSLTIMWYDIGPEVDAGQQRKLLHVGHLTTTIDQIALAFTAPNNLPPAQVYEDAIRASLPHH